ncbi:hypothetical protein PLANPX_5507 [Lacipirellula parvula]|uniref:Uncharacterized protein n=1 Tax=Lacipirellula parvula TaxID=2650471 RepID=A0A5K7XHM4_9BACT|nr:hypothetical protein PLANPX_5507 [Lacipirellula parvula]
MVSRKGAKAQRRGKWHTPRQAAASLPRLTLLLNFAIATARYL